MEAEDSEGEAVITSGNEPPVLLPLPLWNCPTRFRRLVGRSQRGS